MGAVPVAEGLFGASVLFGNDAVLGEDLLESRECDLKGKELVAVT